MAANRFKILAARLCGISDQLARGGYELGDGCGTARGNGDLTSAIEVAGNGGELSRCHDIEEI
ncbi:hypothetical protein C798_12905 [Herbaspirillum rubrisubalbicans Os34]|uniref:Uncharacterized protein n=1 Tax=Herbaspirillum rubrisubalbicans Os34 TaxID=1235827 RepID=A0A6M3ZUA1_9BURK|nr:hypothetical protein C798_12905 [Herbaspirillum rubrisubalbicans Os34]